MRDRVVSLLDMHHMVRRSAHAMEDLTDADGNPTGGLFGALTSIGGTLSSLSPDRVVLFFDGGRDPYRLGIFPEYKNRSEKRPEKEIERQQKSRAVAWQVQELLTNVLPHLGMPFLQLADTEADDLVYAAREDVIAPRGMTTVIVSGDKDFLQMVDQKTYVLDPMDRRPHHPMSGPPLISSQNFQQETKTPNPKSFLERKAVLGDSSDRIPGIKGVGPVTVNQLFDKYGSISGILSHKKEIRAMGRRYAAVVDNPRIIARNMALIGLHHRPRGTEEQERLEHCILNPPSTLNMAAVKSYSLRKQALEFAANLPDLFAVLREQKERSDALSIWLSSRE